MSNFRRSPLRALLLGLLLLLLTAGSLSAEAWAGPVD